VRIGSVYLIKNKINGKCYVGKTARDIGDRIYEHFKPSNKYCRRLRNSIKKYGKNNFEVEIIYQTKDLDDLNNKESFFIRYFNTIHPGGYNLTVGGEGGLKSEETRQLLSSKLKGRDHSYAYKPLIRIDKKTLDIKRYPSLKSAIDEGFDQRQIRAVCKNDRGNYSYKGYYWVYECDFNNFKIHTYLYKRDNKSGRFLKVI
jgi:group I intron endonuclease